MKPIRKFLDKIKPHFQKGGKLQKLHSTFDAFETFLFVPDTTTHKGSHIRDSIDLKRTMSVVVLALMPALLFGMWNVGYQYYKSIGIDASMLQLFWFGFIKVLPIVIVSYVTGLGIEFVSAQIRGHEVNEGFLVSGMLIPLVLPVTIPLWMVALATAFAVIIGKEIFGGTGMNIFNPALVARAFLFFGYPAYMAGDVWTSVGEKTIDGWSGATPLAMSAEHHLDKLPSFNDMFFGFIPGSIGETSTLAILIGAAILIITGIGSWRIILSVFAGGYLFGLLLNWFAPANDLTHYMHIPAHYHLVMGGFAFGAVFMATDPVTASQTNIGKYIYGFIIGVMCVLVRIFNPAYPEGMMLAILFMNMFAPLIDYFVVEQNIKRRLRRGKIK